MWLWHLYVHFVKVVADVFIMMFGKYVAIIGCLNLDEINVSVVLRVVLDVFVVLDYLWLTTWF